MRDVPPLGPCQRFLEKHPADVSRRRMKADRRGFALRPCTIKRRQRLLLDEQRPIRVAHGREKQIGVERIAHVERFRVVVQQPQLIRQQPPDEGSDAPQPAVSDLRHARLARHPSRHVREARRQQIEGLRRDILVAVAAVADQPLDKLRLARVSVAEPCGLHDKADRGRRHRSRESERLH